MTTRQNIFIELANGLQIRAVLKSQDSPAINTSSHVDVEYARAGSGELMHFESSPVHKRTGKQAAEIVLGFAALEAQRLATKVTVLRLQEGVLLNAEEISSVIPAGVALAGISSAA